jgi:hypothetical protein
MRQFHRRWPPLRAAAPKGPEGACRADYPYVTAVVTRKSAIQTGA